MFSDVKDDWAKKEIERVARVGLMVGYPGGLFEPDKPLLRKELASVISRLMFRFCDIADILPEILRSVFILYRGDGEGLGTGFFVSPQGHIVTAYHVVEGVDTCSIIDDTIEGNIRATVIARSMTHDIALLKAEGYVPSNFLQIATEPVQSGDHVAVIGAPHGYNDSVTQGIVSNPSRPEDPISDFDCFQTDSAINPGNSGGPAINGRGQVVGVAVSKFTNTDNMGFCVRAEFVREFLKLEKVI